MQEKLKKNIFAHRSLQDHCVKVMKDSLHTYHPSRLHQLQNGLQKYSIVLIKFAVHLACAAKFSLNSTINRNSTQYIKTILLTFQSIHFLQHHTTLQNKNSTQSIKTVVCLTSQAIHFCKNTLNIKVRLIGTIECTYRDLNQSLYLYNVNRYLYATSDKL